MRTFRRSAEGSAAPALALWPLIDALEEIGGDARALLRRNGLSDPTKLEQETMTISRQRFAAIAGEALAEIHAYVANRDGERSFLLPAFQIMCRAMLSATDLRGAIDVAIEFARVMGNEGAGALEFGESDVFFRLTPVGRDSGKTRFLVASFGAAVIHRLLGWLIGNELALTRVEFSFPERSASELTANLFDLEPRFGAPHTGIGFPVNLLGKPVIRTGADLDQFFRLFPFDLFPPEYTAGSMNERVRVALRVAMARGDVLPGLDTLAENFGTSVSTLRRRLADEGQSLNGLRRALQEESAMTQLAQGRRPIADIAARVGFRDATTFRKAFRLWTGSSPAEWRRLHRATAQKGAN